MKAIFYISKPLFKKKLHFLFYSIFILILLSSYACKDSHVKKRPDFKATGIEVEITQPAGELYNAIKFLPLPVNVAQFEHIPKHELECWVISKRLKKSKNIDVNVFALIQYNDGSLEKKIILTIPSKPKYQTITTSDLMDFSMNHASIKDLLESWLKQYKGSKSSINITWKDKQEALRYYQKYIALNTTK